MLLVTGLSGAGKSTVLNAMEDSGYETIDNVPLTLLPLLISSEGADERMVVVGSEIRSRDFSVEHFRKSIETIRQKGQHDVRILFLTSDDDSLQRRYTETRRKHPLAQDRPVLAGIRQERELLAEIRELADDVLDTTHLSSADLRMNIQQRYAEKQTNLSVFVQSFSFKKGIPREADLLFDVRFLRNPYYVPELRHMSGMDQPIADYIRQDAAYPDFIRNLEGLLMPLLPLYRQEGKSYLTIAVGCTGGQHRSVFVAEELVQCLSKRHDNVTCKHRDVKIAATNAAVKGNS